MIAFNNTSDGNGLIQHSEDDTGLGKGQISGNTDRLKLFTGYANDALSELHNIILKADGRMQFDDPNHANAPVADFDLVNGQKKYEIFEAIPTASQDWLEVESVDILDENDNGVKLDPMDIQDLEVAESEYKDTNGTPDKFDFDGAEMKLYPSPDYDKTDGGIIAFKRAPSYFVYTDTTKIAGFNSDFHRLIHMKMTLRWGRKLGLGYVVGLEREIIKGEADLKGAYTRRKKYERLVLKPPIINSL